MEIRLNKFLAERLGLSRREADDAIAAGRAKINDRVAVLGARVAEGDEVVFDGRPVGFEKEYTYLVFNKPVGYVCSRKKQGENDTIYSLLPEKYRSLKTVGRLDKDTCGLLLLTDDGDLAFELTHPKFMKYKVYLAVLDRSLEPLHQQMIADFGVDLPDGKSRLDLTCLDGETKEARKVWQVGMSEGRNRQIRRTFAALGYRIEFLKRLEFDGLALGDLEEGSFRLVPRPKN
ncbi:rRNA pseudouridine synthase [Candidatus Saccharibacteria bacterium]|nr:rRNA pseudouridine synthase [Candidatus Saccharibacteria bacterium]